MNKKIELMLERSGRSRYTIDCTYRMDDGDRQIVVIDQERPQFSPIYIHSKVSTLPDSSLKRFLLQADGFISEGIFDADF
ncbi:hypothetical protein [Halobacillus sp. A5]|uniref:hypothetical protein n=1 Tax=Halobacillus sp. A5 TaxID=2880263 RepID=UPI0020A68FB8|nr:hypothetical protein [Halobacillus sp. A5]MCP3029619.1 hypothetical protein [Halobacillus sp. A5]